MMVKRLLGLAAALIVVMPPVAFAAGERIDETKDASPDGFVRITVTRGDLAVSGWDRNQIRVSGRLDEQAEAFIFDVRRDDAIIEVKLPRHLNNWCCEEGSDLTVEVPRGSRVDVSVVSTDVDVSDIAGGFEVGSVSGDVKVGTVPGRLEITVVSGDVNVRDASGRIEVKSVSGDMDLVDVSGDVRLHSVSGDILARGVSGELDVESVSGDIEVMRARYQVLRGHTVSGDVDIDGEMAAGGSLEFDSVSGTVRVKFSGKVGARFDIETGSGSIRNRLTDDRPRTSKYSRDESLRFETGDGRGEVMIETRSGDIVLSR